MISDQIFIRRRGRGKPLILLHGWGVNSAVFDAIGTELANSREVITVDLPGYGRSRWDSSMSFSDQAGLIADRLPVGDILGWSMGGLYALEMVQQKPNHFNQVYLVGFNPCFVQREDWACAVAAEIFDEFAKNLADGWDATITRFLNLQMHGVDNARILVRETVNRLKSAGPPDNAALDFGLKLLKQQDRRPQMAGLNIPVKMILGKRDALVPGKLGIEIPALNPQINVELLAAAAHAPFLSHRELFLSML